MEDKDMQVLTFKLDEQEYALHMANVVQVVRMVAVTRAPNAPPVVAGIINLRGRVIPVIDLRRRFNLSARPYGINNHLLIARADGANGAKNGRVLGIIVDVVSEVLSLPAASLDYSADIGLHIAEYLSAVGKLGDRLLLIVDLNSLLTFAEKQRLVGALDRTGLPQAQPDQIGLMQP